MDFPEGPANLILADTLEGMIAQGEKVGIQVGYDHGSRYSCLDVDRHFRY